MGKTCYYEERHIHGIKKYSQMNLPGESLMCHSWLRDITNEGRMMLRLFLAESEVGTLVVGYRPIGHTHVDARNPSVNRLNVISSVCCCVATFCIDMTITPLAYIYVIRCIGLQFTVHAISTEWHK